MRVAINKKIKFKRKKMFQMFFNQNKRDIFAIPFEFNIN